ncbi:origin recognition complex subunit 6 [Phlebotomus papatasi]|uniref:origin recognition complex subunit 6 n=1 Tax=Phlebotomus papatasi TaxID=29031 RepID=UPI0024842E2F|nr:origin recognition complex subunit 6 [Phlebotomus papatasi]
MDQNCIAICKHLIARIFFPNFPAFSLFSSLKMGENFIQNIVRKFGYQENVQMIQKIKENSRLLHLKQNSMTSGIGEIAKIVICTDLAASEMGLSFDTELGQKLCGLRKGLYANNRRIVQKLIGNSKSIGIPALCLQLGLPSQIQETAADELQKYLTYMTRINQDIDRKHPQYAAITLFKIAQMRKIKVSKTSFASSCSLKTDQWKMLEESWEKYARDSKEKVRSREEKTDQDVEMVEETPKEGNNAEEIEDYEVWKKRILARAYENLRKP